MRTRSRAREWPRWGSRPEGGRRGNVGGVVPTAGTAIVTTPAGALFHGVVRATLTGPVAFHTPDWSPDSACRTPLLSMTATSDCPATSPAPAVTTCSPLLGMGCVAAARRMILASYSQPDTRLCNAHAPS